MSERTTDWTCGYRSAPGVNILKPDCGGLVDWPKFRRPGMSDMIDASPVNWPIALLGLGVIGILACLVGIGMGLL